MASITLTVLDANNLPIPDCVVSINGQPFGKTSPSGILSFSPPPNNIFNFLQVSHPQYVTEQTGFRGPISTAEYDNSLITRSSAATTFLTQILGRLESAPTIFKTDSEYSTLAGKNPNSAILFNLPRDPSLLAYRDHWNATRTPHLAEPKLLPFSPPPATAKGWEKFRTSPDSKPVDLMTLGRFFWTLYNNQYAIAIFSPNINSSTPLTQLDMVVFFSPTTAGWPAKYPFGFPPKTVDQSYMNLGRRYLVEDYGFVYNLLGRRRQAIMVMPICKQGDWGPFSSGEGLNRLCREVSVFLHRECRTSKLGFTGIGGVDRRVRHAGGTLRTIGVGIWSPTGFGKVPQVGRVVIGGFSSGIGPVKSVFGYRVPGNFDRKLWGCAGVGEAEAAWKKSWQEIWDLDGYHKETGGWQNFLDTALKWMMEDEGRMLRLFHSLEQPDPKAAGAHKLFQRLISEGPAYEQYKIPGAREIQGKRFTAIHVNGGYFLTDSDKEGYWPPLKGDDGHHAAPKVAFSHFVGLSPVGKVRS
ncbi:hypothetical protein QBC38DRAFT_426169 [Podospora fimiseda]|uniref:Uncharacterized protein n=1 Tax=Podospora fimiseda TaxID=252190 RepID=A0AAN7BG38_9PEZI|nr:hypothetical protein QBC38DRAFT_426169 [Podospora fimiseda]